MVRAYTSLDYPTLCSWQSARNKEMFQSDLLSDIGFIVDDKACGFLYTTNSKVCYIETLLSNPNNKDTKAIDEVVEAIISKAKELGFNLILSTTKLNVVTSRAITHGFNYESNYTLLTKQI